MIRESIARAAMSLACVVALCALVGCPPQPAPPIGPPDAADASQGPPKPKPVTCSTACAHVVALPCPSGKCPKTVAQCMASCQAVQVNAPGFPDCLLSAQSRTAADACDTGK